MGTAANGAANGTISIGLVDAFSALTGRTVDVNWRMGWATWATVDMTDDEVIVDDGRFVVICCCCCGLCARG